MNEKRFTMSYAFDDEEYEYFDKGVPLTPSETCRMLNELAEENEQLKHWNKCLAEKRHNEKESNESLIKKLINKIDFLERIIDGDI